MDADGISGHLMACSFYEELRETGKHGISQRDTAALVDLLRTCAQNKDLHKGANLHADILSTGLLEENPFLHVTLVSMYARCGAVAKAQNLFEGLPIRNVVSWNALIAGYAKLGKGTEALKCFELMQREGFSPNIITLVCILKACGCIAALNKGEDIHYHVLQQNLLRGNVVLGGALVDMYVKCGALPKAKEVLEELPVRNAVTWNSLIAGYTQADQCKEALSCFERMQFEGLFADAVTLVCLLKVCGSIGALEKGRNVHFEVLRQGMLGKNVVLGGALVDMYAKCSVCSKGKEVLDGLPIRDAVSWSALIAGYVRGEHGKEALTCFELMQHEGLSPSAVTFTCILKACGSMGALHKGKSIHDNIIKWGLLCGNAVLGSALVDMYAKCGALSKAKEVLERLPERNVASWNALIAGCVQGEHGEEASNCFERMQREGYSPDAVTFACILVAYGSIGAIDKGETLHADIARQGLLSENVVLGNALVDMYARCGALLKAREVLEGLPIRNVVTWNALIAGYTQEEHGKEALGCFHLMQLEGLSPDEISFMCVLSVCSHSGLLEEAGKYFVDMSRHYDINPSSEHHTSMVKLFGRIGLLDMAILVIKKMPLSTDPLVWLALLSACKKWENVKLGSWAFERATQVDEKAVTSYVYMSNMYATADLKDQASRVDALRLKAEPQKLGNLCG